MVGRVGLEPTTYGLKVRYSAIELAPLAAKRSQLGGPLGNELRTARQRRKGDVRRRVGVTLAAGQGTGDNSERSCRERACTVQASPA